MVFLISVQIHKASAGYAAGGFWHALLFAAGMRQIGTSRWPSFWPSLLRQIMSRPQATQALLGSAALLPLKPMPIQSALIVVGVGAVRHKLFLSMGDYQQQSITVVFPIKELPLIMIN